MIVCLSSLIVETVGVVTQPISISTFVEEEYDERDYLTFFHPMRATNTAILKKLKLMEDKLDAIMANLFPGSGWEDHSPYFVPRTMLDEAITLLTESGLETFSASLIQRHMRVGRARSLIIIDQLEEAGYLGPAEDGRPRKVLKRS